MTTEHSAEGTNVAVSVRGKMNEAVVTKMPFVETHYFRAS